MSEQVKEGGDSVLQKDSKTAMSRTHSLYARRTSSALTHNKHLNNERKSTVSFFIRKKNSSTTSRIFKQIVFGSPQPRTHTKKLRHVLYLKVS